MTEDEISMDLSTDLDISEEAIDFSEAVIDEPDLSSEIHDNPLEEPTLDDLPMSMDLSELDEISLDEPLEEMELDELILEDTDSEELALGDDELPELEELSLDELEPVAESLLERPTPPEPAADEDEPILEDISMEEPEEIDFEELSLEEPADEVEIEELSLEDSSDELEEISLEDGSDELEEISLEDIDSDELVLDDEPAAEALPETIEELDVAESEEMNLSDLLSPVPEALIGESEEELLPDEDLDLLDSEDLIEDLPEELDDLSTELSDISADGSGITGEAIPTQLKEELRTVLSYMDQLLEALPDEKIEEFARSEHYDTYKKLFKELGLV